MKGDVVLEVQGGRGNTEALKREILKNSTDMRVETKRSEDTVFLTRIDGDVTSEEILVDIKRSVGDADTESIKVLSIRPNQFGSQNAILTMETKLARELCKRGTIRIGWTPCRARLRVNIVRCYRCLEFGHHRSECQGTDRSGICMKCGQGNHKAKDCVNINFCLTCKTEGHRADQTKCPHYRKLIQDKAKVAAKGKGPKEAAGKGEGVRKNSTTETLRRINNDH